MVALHLRDPIPLDGPAITAIQAEGLAGGHASFRQDPITGAEFAESYPLAVIAERDGEVLGWSALAAQSDRCVYAGLGEVSTYVAQAAMGQGAGRALLSALISKSEAAGYWTLTAQIFPENAASLALHRALGFKTIGTRERLGRMGYGPLADAWRDVVMLERRSTVVGVEKPS